MAKTHQHFTFSQVSCKLDSATSAWAPTLDEGDFVLHFLKAKFDIARVVGWDVTARELKSEGVPGALLARAQIKEREDAGGGAVVAPNIIVLQCLILGLDAVRGLRIAAIAQLLDIDCFIYELFHSTLHVEDGEPRGRRDFILPAS